MSTFKSLAQLSHEVTATENRLVQLREKGFDEEGTLIITVLQAIGRLRAEISEQQPSRIAA